MAKYLTNEITYVNVQKLKFSAGHSLLSGSCDTQRATCSRTLAAVTWALVIKILLGWRFIMLPLCCNTGLLSDWWTPINIPQHTYQPTHKVTALFRKQKPIFRSACKGSQKFRLFHILRWHHPVILVNQYHFIIQTNTTCKNVNNWTYSVRVLCLSGY